MFSNHPFLQNSSTAFQVLPPQMLSIKEKDEQWKRHCMDALEYIARMQWLTNQKMYLNYKLISGEFVPSEYGIDEEEYADPLSQLTKDFNLPSYIKNYDIISQPLNTMVGELDSYPDTFVVVGKGEYFENEIMRMKSKLLKDFVLNEISQKVDAQLVDKGLIPAPEFNTPEEEQQYQQQLEQERQNIMNPYQIEEWINTKYRHIAEIWGSVELEDQKERFNLYDVRRMEFKDYLTVGRRFRHMFLKANGFGIETWNPINTFYHKSPEVRFIQDGDYVGQIHILSIPNIIDRYGYLMNAEQLEQLQTSYLKSYQDSALVKKSLDGKELDYLSPTGIPYATRVPSLDRWLNEFAPQVKNYPSSTWFLTEEQLDRISGGQNFLHAIAGMYQVTEAYWKSQKKIGKLYWINPELGVPEKILIDESFIVPDYIKQVKEGGIDFKDEDEINTITWTWVNEIWKGTKISNAGTHSNLAHPIYLDIRKHDIQFKGETLIYEAKLPVAGQVANNRNTVSAGFVDFLKPFQFFYNVLMNQAYQYLEKEVIPFILMDVNMLPNDKDWGGKKNLEKWMGVAKSLGIVPADTSPANMQGSNPGGQLPKVIDLDMSTRIIARLQLAQQIKQFALEQVGIAPQRLGDIKSTETATGINQANARSYTQTSQWFTDFFACERDILRMQLCIAQTLQSKQKDILASYTKSDLTNAFLKFNDDDFSLYDLHIYISNSQEELRRLDMVRRLGLENNTLVTKMSDRIKMATSNSIPEIINTLLNSERQEDERRAKEQEMAQQQLDQQQQQFEQNVAKEDEHFYAKLENDLQKAYIQAFGFNEEVANDANANSIPDVLEQAKLISSNQHNTNKLELQRQKLEQDRMNADRQYDLENRKLNTSVLKEKNKLQLEKEKLKRAKVQGDKSK
jgi:hypothetical protein